MFFLCVDVKFADESGQEQGPRHGHVTLRNEAWPKLVATRGRSRVEQMHSAYCTCIFMPPWRCTAHGSNAPSLSEGSSSVGAAGQGGDIVCGFRAIKGISTVLIPSQYTRNPTKFGRVKKMNLPLRTTICVPYKRTSLRVDCIRPNLVGCGDERTQLNNVHKISQAEFLVSLPFIN